MRNCLSRTVHYKMVEPETEEPSGPRVLLFIILDGRVLNQETRSRRRMMRRKRRNGEGESFIFSTSNFTIIEVHGSLALSGRWFSEAKDYFVLLDVLRSLLSHS